MSIKLTASDRYIVTIALGEYYLMKFISKNKKHPKYAAKRQAWETHF